MFLLVLVKTLLKVRWFVGKLDVYIIYWAAQIPFGILTKSDLFQYKHCWIHCTSYSQTLYSSCFSTTYYSWIALIYLWVLNVIFCLPAETTTEPCAISKARVMDSCCIITRANVPTTTSLKGHHARRKSISVLCMYARVSSIPGLGAISVMDAAGKKQQRSRSQA